VWKETQAENHSTNFLRYQRNLAIFSESNNSYSVLESLLQFIGFYLEWNGINVFIVKFTTGVLYKLIL